MRVARRASGRVARGKKTFSFYIFLFPLRTSIGSERDVFLWPKQDGYSVYVDLERANGCFYRLQIKKTEARRRLSRAFCTSRTNGDGGCFAIIGDYWNEVFGCNVHIVYASASQLFAVGCCFASAGTRVWTEEK